MQELDAAIPKDWTVVSGGAHFAGIAVTHMHGRRAENVHVINDFGAIGSAFPIAIGVAAARGDGKVLLIEGDGSLMMHIQELETIRRHGIRMLICAVNDGGYGAEVHKFRAQGYDPKESLHGRGDIAAIARGFGCAARRSRRWAGSRTSSPSTSRRARPSCGTCTWTTRFRRPLTGGSISGRCEPRRKGALVVIRKASIGSSANGMSDFKLTIPRSPLYNVPDVVILADVKAAQNDPNYTAAKGGDELHAAGLIKNLIGPDQVATVRWLLDGRQPILSPVHAIETTGVNEIPIALAESLAEALALQVELSVIQDNTVGHTGADGWHRLANAPIFGGVVVSEAEYLLVDDFIGQGGTLANLRGYIESKGGRVLGAVTLTGKPYSARLAPDRLLIEALRAKHGKNLEDWWQEQFGYGFDCLTHSEARYLERVSDVDAIRTRVLEARQGEGLPETPRTAESGLG